jgi:amino acid permease
MQIKSLLKNYIYPAVIFCGGMIGVGFLSLPYITTKVGIIPMIIYFFIVTALMLALNIIFVEISLKTPDFKRFPGFASHYLGKWGGFIAFLCIILGTIGVLLAYIIIGGEFLSGALQPFFSGNNFIYTFIYFLLASIIIYFDIKVIARVEMWVLAALILCLIFIFIKNFSFINLENLFILNSEFKISNLFLPFGPLVFALWGVGLIPEVEEMLIKKKKLIKKIIFYSILAVSVFYFLFVILIVSITGQQTTESALAGLKNFLGNGFSSLALIIGAFATFTAFVAHGIILKKTLIYDLGIKHWQAFVMTCFTPMILFLAGLKSFIGIISFIGGFLLGIEGILILLMYKKIPAYRQTGAVKKMLVNFLFVIFALGIIYEVVYFVK